MPLTKALTSLAMSLMISSAWGGRLDAAAEIDVQEVNDFGDLILLAQASDADENEIALLEELQLIEQLTQFLEDNQDLDELTQLTEYDEAMELAETRLAEVELELAELELEELELAQLSGMNEASSTSSKVVTINPDFIIPEELIYMNKKP